MIKKSINLLSLIGIALVLLFVNLRYPDVNLQKGYITFFATALSYFLLKFLFDELVVRKVKGSRTRYSLRKAMSIFFVVFLIIIILRIWLPNAQALLVSYGLIAAGVAISLQDFFKNIVGGITIFTSGQYSVGDRIEINGKYGDVMDIGLMYTTLLEVGEWVNGDQATGRIVTIPNGLILSKDLNNYTKDHNFIWDEIMIPITYKSDWELAKERIKEIVTAETLEVTKQAKKEMSSLENKYYVSRRNVDPDVFIVPTDNWIAFYIRYITDVRERRITHNKLSQLILKEILKLPQITIASSTIAIVENSEIKK